MARPRSTEADTAILDAAIGEYACRGLEGLSVDAVAARAGVSKATIYRRYPSKVDLVVAAAYRMCEEQSIRPDTGSVRGDLVAQLANLRRMLADPVLGAAKRMLIVDATQNDDLASTHRELVEQRREHTLALFRRGIERGELRPDFDLEFAADQIGGPVFYRHLLMHEIVDDAYIDRVVDGFLAHYGVPAEASVRVGKRTLTDASRGLD
jgi:AcrR family transcriptional regulator